MFNRVTGSRSDGGAGLRSSRLDGQWSEAHQSVSFCFIGCISTSIFSPKSGSLTGVCVYLSKTTAE